MTGYVIHLGYKGDNLPGKSYNYIHGIKNIFNENIPKFLRYIDNSLTHWIRTLDYFFIINERCKTGENIAFLCPAKGDFESRQVGLDRYIMFIIFKY